MIKPEATKGDRSNDEEDDNWDDWGDAEDYSPEGYAESQADVTNPISKNVLEECPLKTTDAEEKYSNPCENTKSAAELQPQNNSKSWSSVWGKPWGGVVSSVFSTATEGLGSITSSVSQGLTNVIGVPEPEELARLNASERLKMEKGEFNLQRTNETSGVKVARDQLSGPTFGINIVSGVTTLGSKVLNTGLDTLEGIGKKTMDILQENDPLLLNKRKILGLEPEKPNLSEILKEAKKESDRLEDTLKELKLERDREQIRFEILFENNCGVVHMDALEILSTESGIKLESLLSAVSGKALAELNETVNEVKELMEFEDLEGESDGNYDENKLNENLMAAIEDLDLQINFDDLKKNWAEALNWLNTAACDEDVQEVFAKGVAALADACSLEVNKLHKIAELILVKEHHSTASEVDSIVQLCKHFMLHLNGIANRFASALSAHQEDDAKAQINNLFGEMWQAMHVIERAFKLFLPILQIGAV